MLGELEVLGKYTVTATFAGTESFWPSFTQSAISISEAAQATPEPTATVASIADMYFIPSIAEIIAAIIIGFVLVMLMA